MSPARRDPPAPRSPIVGRDRDVADIGRLLGVARMVTLTGAGGIGKTCLAVRVAEREGERFADGVVFVDLSMATTGEHVLYSVASRLDITADREQSLWEAVPLALRSQELLLVLDTCEHVVAPLARLCRALLRTCPHLRLLTTSQEPLRIPGENIWRVPPLALPTAPVRDRPADGALPADPTAASLTVREAMRSAAVRLFASHARRARPGFAVTADNLAAVVRICRMLDGVPLAIELAASRLRVLSVEQLLRRLDDRFALLHSADPGLPERQRTMRATVEWSHALLTEPERALLRRLSIFANWSLEMAEDLFRADFGDTLLDLHGSLLDKSLIVVDAEFEDIAYYRMLDTIRVHAAELLRASGEADAYCRRTLEYGVGWVRMVPDLMARPLPWRARLRLLDQVEHSRDNIHSFLNWAAEHGQAAPGLRICTLLRPYWLMRDRCAEGAAFLDALFASAPDDLPADLRADALVLRGELTLDLDGTQAGEARIRAGLRLAEEAGADAVRGGALTALAAVSLRLSELRAGAAQITEALRIARGLGDRVLESRALELRGLLAGAAGNRTEARRNLTAALTLAEDLGCGWQEAHCRSGLGILAIREGEDATAQEHLDHALTLFVATRSSLDAARCLSELGRLAARRGEAARAWEYLSEGVRRSAASGRRLALARAMESLARFAADEGLTDRVVLLGAQAETLRRRANAPSRRSRMLREYVEQRSGAAALAAWTNAGSRPLEEVLAAALPAPSLGDARLLTRRERQVAELAGAGLSNREIAARLVISQATVARHVANIFTKLGISARTELAARLGPRDGPPNSPVVSGAYGKTVGD